MILALLAALASAGECVPVTAADVLDVKAPGIVVLGERHGTQPDLRRATRVVRSYAARMRTTVALEAVPAAGQATLDAFAAGSVPVAELPARLDWERAWGFPWAPYAPLVTASRWGAKVVGAGLPLGGPPEGREVPVPPRYVDLLRDAMGGHDIPLGQEARFVQAMAWRDLAIAEAALAGWDGKGWLVVVTGRGHVEGGKGVAWQLDRLSEAPVHSFVLAWGEDPPCYPGDRLWR